MCYHNLIKDFVEVRSMETQSKRKRLLDTDVEKAKKVATKPSIESESKVSQMMGFSNFATSKK